MTNQPHSRFHEAMVLGLIWAIVGIIYSTLLVVMLAFFRGLEFHAMGIGLAATLAGAVGALFYGSMRLAILATLAAMISAFGYLALLPQRPVNPQEMLLVSGLAGLIVGGHYGYLVTDSRVYQATAKALTGLYAGFVAGMPLTLLAGLYGTPQPYLAAAILTPATGLIYVLALKRVMALLDGQPSALISGALVGCGVAGLMGVAVWAFVGVFNSTVTGDATEAVRFAWASLPGATLGGAAGGFTAGALLGLIGVRLNTAVGPGSGSSE